MILFLICCAVMFALNAWVVYKLTSTTPNVLKLPRSPQLKIVMGVNVLFSLMFIAIISILLIVGHVSG